jgi:hypothetical protein
VTAARTDFARGHEAGVAQERAVQYEVRHYVAGQLEELAARRHPAPDDAAELISLSRKLRGTDRGQRKGEAQ